jgi:hypothetical protein
MSEPITDQAAVILLERVAVPLVNRAGSGIWWWFTAHVLRRPSEVVEGAEVSTDFIRKVGLQLRGENAVVLDVTSVVPNVAVYFEVINHSGRRAGARPASSWSLRVGQPTLNGIMGHRYPIEPHETVSTITFKGC